MSTLQGEEVAYNRPDPVHAPLVAAGRERQGDLVALFDGVKYWSTFRLPESFSTESP